MSCHARNHQNDSASINSSFFFERRNCLPTYLQDYSTGLLSQEFTELFASSNFADEIGKWFEDASNFVVEFIEGSSNVNSKKSEIEFFKQITVQKPILTLRLSENIWKKQNTQKLLQVRLQQSEWDFISPDPGTHENICIFDWIHEFSLEQFPRFIDGEMIHLVFDFFGIPTFCRCDFQNIDNSNLTYQEYMRLMLRTTSFEGTVKIPRLKSNRLLEILEFYRTLDGIKIWNKDL